MSIPWNLRIDISKYTIKTGTHTVHFLELIQKKMNEAYIEEVKPLEPGKCYDSVHTVMSSWSTSTTSNDSWFSLEFWSEIYARLQIIKISIHILSIYCDLYLNGIIVNKDFYIVNSYDTVYTIPYLLIYWLLSVHIKHFDKIF